MLQSQFEYQQQILKLHEEKEEIRREREHQDTTERRRKDAIMAAIPKYQEKDDLEDYISSLEDHFRQCMISRKDWTFYLSALLTGKVAGLLSDIRETTDDDYDDVKAKLLRATGYTERDATYQYFNTKVDDIRGMSADHTPPQRETAT